MKFQGDSVRFLEFKDQFQGFKDDSGRFKEIQGYFPKRIRDVLGKSMMNQRDPMRFQGDLQMFQVDSRVVTEI